MTRWQRGIWRFLGSRRLAVVLLISLLLLLLLASLFPQMPAAPESRARWMEALTLRFGPATGLLKGLGMFDAYHAPWFLALLAALLLNTLVCTIQRLPRIWHSLTEPPILRPHDPMYQSLRHRATWTLWDRDQGLAVVQDVLTRHGFRPQIAPTPTGDPTGLYAQKGRWSQAGTLIGHMAAILLFLAMVIRPALGWQEGDVLLLPGETYHVGHGYDLDVRPGKLDTEPQLSVPLAVLTEPVAITTTVGVNHPASFRGVAFHLQSYGPAVQIAAPEGTFDMAFTDSQAQQVDLPEAGLALRVAHQPGGGGVFVEALGADDSLLGSGIVPTGQTIEIRGVPITFRPAHYTVWQASHDPTFPIAVASGILLLAAAVISLWVPDRRLWLWMDPQGHVEIVGAGDWAADFDRLAGELAEACRPREEDDG